MFRKSKSFLCLLLAALMLLGGCSGNANVKKQTIKGGYRETEINMPEGYEQVSNPLFLKDGRVIMVATRMYEQVYMEGEVPLSPDKMNAIRAAAGIGISSATVYTAAEDAAADSGDAAEGTVESGGDAATGNNAGDTADGDGTDDIMDITGVDKDYIMPDYEYVPVERKQDILTWKDLSAKPTVDPLKLPAESYFDSQNALLADGNGNPVLRVNSYDQETWTQKFSLYWLPDTAGAGKDAEPVAPVKELTLDLGDTYPNSIIGLPGGKFVASCWDSIKVFGEDGKKEKEILISYSNQMFLAGDKLITVDTEKSELVYFDAETLEESMRKKVGREIINNAYNGAGFEDGTIYLYGQYGIYKLDSLAGSDAASDSPDKIEAEMILDFLQYSMADPDIYPIGFAMGSGKQILVTANSSSGMYYNLKVAAGETAQYPGPRMHIFLYKWDPELDLSNKTVLSVSSLFTDRMLRVAAYQFQKTHPDVHIKITQYYDKMENDMKWSDFIRTVNTDILSGKISDVMFLDNLPLASYMRRGILVDLAPLIEELGTENLNMGIVNGMKDKDGKLYALPLVFTTYALIGHKNVVDQVTDLQSLLTLKLEPDQKALVPIEKQYLFQQLLMANLPAFVDAQTKNYRFDTPEFIGFLELFDRIYHEAQNPPPELPENPTEEDYMNMDYGNFYQDLQKLRYTGKYAMNITTLGNLDNLSYEFTYSGGKDASWTFLPMVKDMGGQVFLPQTTLGISAKGKNQELALEFVKTFFTGELEGLDNYMWGFSIVKSQQEKAITKLLEEYKRREEMNGMGGNQMYIDENLIVDMVMLSEQQMRDIVDRLDECNIPVQYDQTLYEFLSEEINPFLYGRKTAKEAAEALQRRAAAYLAE